jgi:hypothetical protein
VNAVPGNPATSQQQQQKQQPAMRHPRGKTTLAFLVFYDHLGCLFFPSFSVAFLCY